MAGSRTLKLNILAETKDLVDGLRKADDETQRAGSKIGEGFKKVGLAVAAAGAAVGAFAVKLAVDGVKAAIEDEAAQARLANALKNTTDATNEQIAAVEAQITKIALATGVADDQLRPAYQRLATATGDMSKSQDLLNLALDISAATGKDLESVSNALGKAYEGSTTSLGKLGIGMSRAEIEAAGLEGTMAILNEKFSGAAATQADTFQGKIARLEVAFDETKETIGAALLPVLSSLFDYINNYIIPLFDTASKQFEEKVAPALGTIIEALRDFLIPTFQALWTFLTEELIPLFVKIYEKIVPVLVDAFERIKKKVEENEESLKPLLETLKTVWEFISNTFIPLALEAVIVNFESAVKAVELFIDALGILMDTIKPILEALESMVDLLSRVGSFLFGGGGGGGGGGGSMPSVPSAPSVPQPLPPGVMSTIASATGMGGSVTINVNGTVLDPEGTARAIQSVLVNSASRAGALSLTPVLSI